MRVGRIAFALAVIAGAAGACVGLLGEWRSPLNGDAAWILYCAGRMLDSARLYRDIVEINPPLVFWLNVPVVWAARLAGLSEGLLFRLVVVLLATAALGLSARLLPLAWRNGSRLGPLAVLVGLSIVLLPMPAGYFGQREHLTLALVLPYLFAAAAEAQGRRPSRGLCLTVGFAAALGFALKPHFLVVWFGVMLYGWARERRRYRWLGPMNLTIGVGLVAYGLAVLIASPEYLGLVSTLGGAYQRFSARPVLAILTRDSLPLSVLATLAVYVAFRRAVREPVFADHLAIAAGGFLLAVVLQGKGFGYHYLAAIGTSVLLLATILFGRSDRAGPLLSATAVACAALVLVGTLWPFCYATLRRARGILSPVDAAMVETAAMIRSRAAGRPIAVLSPRLADAFPLVLYSGTTWGLRVPNLWCIQSVAAETPAERWCVGSVGEDLERQRPELVLVRRWSPEGPADLGFDFMAPLRADPRFEREFSWYEPVDTVADFEMYRRRLSAAPTTK